MTPGAPGTALPHRVRWALLAASSRPRCVSTAQKAWPRPRVEACGMVVTLARQHLPYGTSAHHGARYAHLVRFVWIAWQGGRIVGWRARWWCGATCDAPALQLTAEPSRQICPMCHFQVRRQYPPREKEL